MMERLEPCIQRTCEVFDSWDPNWYTYIDLDILDMSDGRKCIAGQLVLYKDGETIKSFPTGKILPPVHTYTEYSCYEIAFLSDENLQTNKSLCVAAELIWSRKIEERHGC